MVDAVPSKRKPVTGRGLFVLASTVILIIVLALAAKASVDRLSVHPWGNARGDSRSAEVAGDTHVGQQFTAPYPGLYRIELALDGARVNTSHPVTFHLKTSPSAAKDLWSTEFSTSDAQGDPLRSFEFPVIRDSKARTYYFYLKSPESPPGDALAARYSPDAIVDGGSAHLNGQPADGNLQFLTYYSLRTRDKADLLLARMADGRPYLLGTKGFYASLVVIYVLVLGLFLWRVAQVILQEEG
jgi:hypothetical protein